MRHQPLSQVQPPEGYQVVNCGFRNWNAYAPDGSYLGNFEAQAYAANRCHRHSAGLSH